MKSATQPTAVDETAESARLEALEQYGVLDTLPEQGYDDITELAAFICGTPISLISLVGKDRQWFKSEHGLGIRETPRDQSFCAHTIEPSRTLIVEDATTDDRFKDNPLVLGDPNIRFYAGAPIIGQNGNVLGTVCVIDTQPRTLSPQQVSALEALSRQVLVLLEQRKAIADLKNAVVESAVSDRLRHDDEKRLLSFVDSIPALAWMANADGWIFWYNHRWYEYTGTSPKEMEGWGWQSVHDPEVLPAVMERWQNSINARVPFEMVFPLRGADGVLRSFLTRIVPFRDGTGEIMQWFGTNTEIDELQRTQRELEASEARLNQALTATSDAVISIDRDWTLTYLNPVAERLYGLTRNLVGRDVWQAFPDIFYEGSLFVEHYRRAMDDGVIGSFETEYGDPASALTIGIEVYPHKEGIVTFSRDITKLNHAKAAVLQNEKLAAVGRLASSIAHEINNPLESVTNLLYLARYEPEPALVNDYLDSADRELRRISAITSQTLRFYRQNTKPTSISCSELFGETLSLYQGRLLNSSIQVEKRKRAQQPTTCFEGEIRQVLSNLIGNAIDAMPQGGRLLLRSRETTHWQTGRRGLALTIADTGSGMAPQVRRKIFDAFYSTKGIAGTGLGLWISKEIVDRHHGAMSVRSSEAPHAHGTVFTLFLPFEFTTE